MKNKGFVDVLPLAPLLPRSLAPSLTVSVTAKALRGVAGAIDPLVPVPVAPDGAGGSVSRHEPDSFSRAELEEYLDEYASMEEQVRKILRYTTHPHNGRHNFVLRFVFLIL